LDIEPTTVFKVDLQHSVDEAPFVISRPKQPQWNVKYIKADKVWKHFDIRGEDYVFASSDTGVQWDHPILKENYRGYSEEGVVHDYSWWDGVKKPIKRDDEGIICGFDAQQPCDDDGHGTHTTSTVVGRNGYGSAPRGKFIACRNMDRGYGSTISYLSCLNFFFAPTNLKGENPNPDLRPHVIGNSYGCPTQEGCSKNAFRKAAEALRAAGIFMSVSAGNEGPRCSTINDPPAFEVQRFPISLIIAFRNLCSRFGLQE
jgi:subtilisin family serine protease